MRRFIIVLRQTASPETDTGTLLDEDMLRRRTDPNGDLHRCVVPGEGFEPPTFGLQNRCSISP
jgi:hypothetical protein